RSHRAELSASAWRRGPSCTPVRRRRRSRPAFSARAAHSTRFPGTFRVARSRDPSGGRRTLGSPMASGTWQLAPSSHRGVHAPALAVLLLQELGADVSWHLPSRFEEGYGLNAQTLTRLAEESFDLVLTVDCGITAVEEVEHAASLGLEVVVTDHHRPAETFP